MILLQDSREQQPLKFKKVEGVEVKVAGLPVGDYGAEHEQEGGEIIRDMTVVERKSVSDLFNSFTGKSYERERAKIKRAKTMGMKYVLAVEATVTEVLKGHSYWNGFKQVEHPKSGLAMFRQLCTIQRKYGIEVWFCAGRAEMAWRVMEYFLAQERVKA